MVATPAHLRRSAAALGNEEVLRIRNDFPILQQHVNGRPLVYLDSGATSQNPLSVLDAEQDFYEQRNAAVHRGAHHLAVEATELFEDARATVAGFVGAGVGGAGLDLQRHGGPQPRSPTRSATRPCRAPGRGGPVRAWPRATRSSSPRWSTTPTSSPGRSWRPAPAPSLRFIPVDDDGALDLEAAAGIIGPRTRVLAFTHVSNVLGTVNPVAELVALARSVGALVVLDACQSAPHLPLDVTALDVDFAVFSGHKMLGPTGIGALYGRSELLDALPPFLTGGSMITTVTMERRRVPAAAAALRGRHPAGLAGDRARRGGALPQRDRDGPHRTPGKPSSASAWCEGLGAIPGVRVLGPRGRGRNGSAWPRSTSRRARARRRPVPRQPRHRRAGRPPLRAAAAPAARA